MINIYRINTMNQGDTFAFLEDSKGYNAIQKIIKNQHQESLNHLAISIEETSDEGRNLNSVDLVGLTVDTFVLRKSLLQKYNRLLDGHGLWIDIGKTNIYKIFIVDTVIDLIDSKSSLIHYYNDSGNVMDIQKYSFKHSDALLSAVIFRSSLAPSREILCTDNFIESYRTINGTGLEFCLLGSV